MQSLIISYGKRIVDKNVSVLLSAYNNSRTGALLQSIHCAYRNSCTGRLLNSNLTGNSLTYALLQSIAGGINTRIQLPTRWQARQREIIYAVVVLLLVITALSFYLLPYRQAGLVLVAVVLTAATFYRTEYGVYAAALLLPFAPQKYLLGLALLSLLSLLWKKAGNPRMRFYLSPIFIPLLLLYLVMFYATVTSISFWDSAGEFVIPIIGLIYLLVIVNTIDSREKLEKLLICLIVAGLVTASYALYQFYTGISAVELKKEWVDIKENPNLKNRAYAVFDNPNLLAQYMILVSMLSLGAVFSVKRLGLRVLFGTTAFIAAYCLLLTYSRGGWLSFAGALLVLALFKNKLLVQLLAAAGLLLYSMLPLSITSRLATITSTKDTSNLYRLDTWNSTMELIRQHWETGVGLGRKAFARVYYTHMINSNIVPHSHNLYLQIISEFGILGLAIFCWLFIAVFRLGLKLSTVAGSWVRNLNAGVMGALAGFLIHSMVDYFLWYYKLGIMIWLLLAIVIVLEKIELKNSDIERNEQVVKAGG